MDFEKVGGRKFVLSLILILVGAAVELFTTRGITMAFAGLLGTILATFSATNMVITNKGIELKKSEGEATEGSQVIPPPSDIDVEAIAGKVTEKLAPLNEAIVGLQQATLNNGKLIAALLSKG